MVSKRIIESGLSLRLDIATDHSSLGTNHGFTGCLPHRVTDQALGFGSVFKFGFLDFNVTWIRFTVQRVHGFVFKGFLDSLLNQLQGTDQLKDQALTGTEGFRVYSDQLLQIRPSVLRVQISSVF